MGVEREGAPKHRQLKCKDYRTNPFFRRFDGDEVTAEFVASIGYCKQPVLKGQDMG